MIHLSYEQEITLIKRLVMAQGVSEEDAASLAAVVTHSDFTGTYSHGLSRLCIYLRQYMAGALVAKPDFRCVKDSDASLAFDCGGGSGIVAVNRVYDAVLERARKFGVAAGVGRNSANIGCGGYYGHRMAEDNVIGIVVSRHEPDHPRLPDDESRPADRHRCVYQRSRHRQGSGLSPREQGNARGLGQRL